MYVRCNPNKNNIKYLSYVKGFRDKNGKVKQITIEKIGNWEDLIKLYKNPVAHFNSVADKRESELGFRNDDFNFIVSHNENMPENFTTNNLGYSILKKIYNELTLKDLFKEKENNLKIDYDLNSIFELLIYSRILFPASKNETYNNKNIFFEKFDFSLKDLYRSLDYFSTLKDDVLTSLWNATKEKYKRDTSVSYYDCTNYYFEISYNDEDLIDEEGKVLEKGYRKKGPSKEHRKTPIVQLGLLMDSCGIPLSYDLFPGNESEKTQLLPTLKKAKSKFGIDRTIIVADRGLNTSDNTVFIAGKNDDENTNHDGYVYGQSIIGADKEFKSWTLDQKDYVNDFLYDEKGNKITYKETIRDDDGNILRIEDKSVIFKHKSRMFAKTVTIEREGKRKNKYHIYQKQMVYYSRKYAIKQKKDREQVLLKAQDLIANPRKYTAATSYGATKYINNIKFDKETGVIPDGLELTLKLDKIREEEKYDGYYSIVTSEKHLSDLEIRNIYKGLWEIEETFKISKSTLETRPVYVWTKEHIEAHFLTCFVSLVILRLLEIIIDKKYSLNYILNSLRNLNCAHIKGDIYTILHRDFAIKDIENIFSFDFSKKYINLSNIKKITTNKK